jgi:large repetitive protein
MEKLYSAIVSNRFAKILVVCCLSIFTLTNIALAQCDNCTDGGSIGSNQTGCVGFDPAAFTNVSSPSGGTGAFEVIWMYWNASTNWGMTQVSGATGMTYDPGPVYENTYFRRCARRVGCSTYTGESNDVYIEITTCNTCSNVTSGGSICCNQSGCPGFDPANIASSANPSGGSGALEIVWMYSNASTGWNLTQVSGATGLSYNPGPVFEDTYFRRCARRAGCSSYVGESNDVFIDITNCCTDQITSIVINDLNGGSDIVLSNGATFSAGDLPSSWNVEAFISGGESVQFNWSGNASYSHVENQSPYRSTGDNVALNFGAGTYTLNALLFNADNASGTQCDSETIAFTINACSNVTNPGVIGVGQSGCAPYDPFPFVSISAASGGSGTLEYVWIYRNASTGNQWETIPNSNSATYDAPAVSQTTEFRRCARRSNCNDFIGESNILVVSITSNCTPTDICYINNYSSGDPRSFYIPGFGTQFSSTTSDPLRIERFANGHAHIVGTIQRNSDNNQKFFISFWFDTKSTFMQWIAMGMAPHNPDQGDETTWTYYKWSTSLKSFMIGQGSLAGVNLNVFNSINGAVYGLQLGNGAGSIMTDANGISTWFSYDGTHTGNGDINGIYSCPPVCSNVTNPGVIGVGQSGCAPYDPFPFVSISAASGGSGTLEYVWIYRNASTGNQWTSIANSNSATYDAPAVSETTEFRRCARRSGCPDFIGESNILVVSITSNCTPTEICYINNYSNGDPRVFWIPDFGTDFTSTSSDPLRIEKFANGHAHIVGTIQRNSNNNQKFYVSFWYDTKSTFMQWIAMGLAPHSPEQGDETTWTYYKWSTALQSNLIGQDALSGVNLNVFNSVNGAQYGLQLGNGAGSIMTDANGISAWFSYSGTNTGNGDINGIYVCPAVCAVNVDAGPNQHICGPVNTTLTATVTGASNCNTTGVTDCNHTLNSQGGWLEAPNNATVCGDNAGTKLWTQSGQGTSFLVLDLGTVVPAGTQICANLKLEHCSNTSSGYSNAKLESSTNASSGYSTLANSITFSQNTYAEYCYTLSSPARFIKVSDNGNCAFRVDYVEYTTTGSTSSVTYAWSGPGIVGSTNTPSVTVNQPGTYTVTITDCNNCTDSDSMIITNDNQNPVFNPGQQSAYALNCGQSVPVIQPTATDNSGVVNYSYTDASTCNGAASYCNCYVTRTWVATDNCSLTSTFVQTFSYSDTVAPTLNNVPANTTVSCDAIPNAPVVTASDNCDTSLNVQFNQTATTGCPYVITRTWSVTDDCGLTTTASQTINVVDTTNPILIGVPADDTVECSNIPAAAVVTYNDNCANDLEVGYYEQFVPNNTCTYTLIRSWTVVDHCGNIATDSQVLTVVDTIDPTLVGVPANITVECDAIPSTASVSGADNCDDDVAVSMEEVISEGCPYTITRTWTGVDECGNDVTGEQVITVIDTTYPVLHGVPANQELECDQPVPNAVVWATDNCTTDLTVDMSADTDDLTCGSVFTRTWSVTDACGNTTTATQVITFVDTTDPYITNAPVNIDVECSDDIPAYVPIWGDNCDESLTLSAASSIAIDDCYEVISQSYTATDDCGNSTTVYRSINIIDTTAPVLSGVPADATVECSNIPAAAQPTATDNCDEQVNIVYNQEIVEGDACTYTIVRTWTATDECGNQDYAEQVLTVVDTTNPILVGVPADDTVECSAIPVAAIVTYTDNCADDLEVGYYEQFVPNNACTYTLIRSWTVVDHCGNIATDSQVLTVVDTTNPTLVGVPSNITVECDAIPSAASVSGADNCDDDVAVTMEEVISEGCPYTITRTWTGVDECGNDVTGEQVITVIDTTYPVLHGVPANQELECDQPVPNAVIWATDNCSEDLVVDMSANTQENTCGSVFTRTWSVTDACGNTTTATQVITFVDTTDPYITNAPVNIDVECSDDIPAYIPIWGDNCDESLTLSAASSIAIDDCYEVISQSYTATDDCGNSTTVYRSINIIDTTAPVLSGVPADATVECSNIPAAAQPTATDNCDEQVDIVYNQEIVAGDACTYTIVRTWTATDECGNQDVAEQVLTVTDTTNPILVGVPADDTVECSAIPVAAIVTYTDNCADDLEVGYNEQFVPNNTCTYTLIRSWTVVDHCGNIATDSQVLTVVDTIDPTLVGVPANITVECDAIPSTASVSGADNCDDDVAVSMEEVISEGCPYTITRTWTGVDECGNDVTGEQVITVIDTTYPVLHGVPANQELECDQPVPNAVVWATDNCTTDLTVDMSADTDDLTCGSVFTRTWSVTDACGNTTTATQVITFVDTTDPYITNAPVNIDVECSDDIPAYVPIWGDNCDESLTLSAASSIAIDDCYEVISQSYTATDDCGNSTTVYRSINIIDTTAPVLSGVPADATVECSNIPAAAQPTATDNCDEQVNIVYNQEIVEGDACTYTIVRTWTATDECGNQDVAEQVLTVTDTTNPILVGVPADDTVECSNIPVAAVVTYSDNCADDLEVGYYEQFVPNNACTYTLIRSWTVVDHCGNIATDSQVLTVVDTTNPTLVGVPANITVECDAIPSAASVSGADNCDDDVAVTMEEVISEGCPYTITRTWTGVDDCGNDVTGEQVITVIDTTFPVLHGVPANQELECDQPVPNAVVWATDNCITDMTVDMSADTDDLTCGSVFTRTWSVTDACGNTTTATQVITFVDTTDPYITNAPVNIDVECSDDIPAYVPIWGDNCDESLTLSAASSIAIDDCYEVISQSYTATDDCGNSTTVYRSINIIDTTAPVLSGVPADATVECSNIPAAAQPTVTDNCDEQVNIVYNQEIVEGDACTYTIVRTWIATDECGNQDYAEQVLTVVDTTNPILINVPANAIVECSNIPSAAEVTYSDNCADDLEIEFVEFEETGSGCTYLIYRTWTVEDHCGNQDTHTQILQVVDTTDPILVGVPANSVIECDAIPSAANVYGEDNCDDDVAVTMEEVISEGCPYTITRTWTGVDECGNDVTGEQVITVIDTTYPELHGIPANQELECDQPVPNAVVWATDNCTTDMTVDMSADTDDLTCGSVFTRTWSVTDACGNTTTATQVITFVDTTDPYITNAPVNIDVECSDDIPAYVPIWGDNCDESLTLSAASSIAIDDCYEIISQSYTATDDCGNSTTVYRSINIIDTTAPVLSGVPADATVECSNIPAAAQPTATDNCDEQVNIVYNQEIVEGDACTYTIVRTWTATDECGNQDYAEQVLTVTDTTNPILVGVPADDTVECSAIPVAAIVTYTDNCADDLEVGYNEQFVPNNACTYTLIRSWTVIDHCGNIATDSQVLTVVDTTAPVLTGVDSETTLECNVMPSIVAPIASDLCDAEVEVVFDLETIAGDCPNAWTEVYTWTATDNCGNEAVRTIIFHFEDTTAPVLSAYPASLVLDCTSIPSAPSIVADDNCDDNVEVTYEEEIVALACGFEVVRTWSATDDCGNVTNHTQIITAVDNTNPTLVNVIPSELTIECGNVIPTYNAVFTDNCDNDLSVIAISGINNSSDCGYDIERAWTATDDCGNAITVTQVVHVVDTTSPVLVGVPANTMVECNAIPTAPFVSATDACDETPNVSFNQTITEGCPYTITRTWTATDACGNESTLSQVINVIDTTAPVLSGVPVYATVECANVPAAPVVSAQDICSGTLEVTFNEEVLAGDGCEYTIERTWTATDACGNDVSATQVLTVIDTTNPWLNNVPSNDTVECDAIPAAALVTGSDICDQNVEVIYNESMTTGCPYVITRTWTAIDNCGNTTSATQTLTVIDTMAPVLSAFPADATFECGDIIPAAAVLTANDNCFSATVNFEEVTVAQSCGYILERTWTATDACGNESSHIQLVYVLDETSPIIVGIPSDMIIECDDEVPAPVQLFASDNCDGTIAVQTNDVILDQDCFYQIKRYYSATDACGNMTSIPQIITIVDVTAPTMAQPQDITVSCDQVPAPIEMIANDNCDMNVTVTFDEVIGGGCPYTITRTWTATDDCGNTFSVDQVISVFDASAPSFLPYEGYVQMECDQVGSYLLPAIDNCDSDVTVVVSSEFQVSGECYGQLLRTYVATDNCGNTSEAFQIIDLIDTTAPVIEGVPADMSLTCGSELPALPVIVATDNCTEEPIVNFTQTQTNQFCPYDIVRSWSAMDLCGNITIVEQVIHVTVDVPGVIDLQAYPNPTSGDFTVKFSLPASQQVKAAIYDVTGKMVAPLMDGMADGGRLYEWPVNGELMEAGSYVIMVNTNATVEHKKLVISK